MAITKQELEQFEELQSTYLEDAELSEALTDVRRRLQVVEARMEQLEQAAVRIRREEHLLESLLALRRGDEMPGTGDLPTKSAQNGQPTPKADAIEAAVALLRRMGRPMHIGEIMESLGSQGIRPPGKGTQANLISYLRRDSRVARPSRGMYGLVELGIKDYQPKKRRTKRRRTRKRSS